MASTVYRLGDWRVEPQRNRLARDDDVERHLEPLAMNVLEHLLERPGEAVSTDELLDAAWSGRVVEPNAVHRCINQVRSALGDDPRRPRYVETIPKRGYRTVAPVRRVATTPAGEATASGRMSAAGTGEDDTPPGIPVPSFTDTGADVGARCVVEHPTGRDGGAESRRLPAGRADAATGSRPVGPEAERIERLHTQVAVVALENHTDVPELDALAETVAEDVGDRIAAWYGGLRLVGERETRGHRRRGASAREIARAFDVELVLRGSMRRLGGRIRIVVELVTADGARIWSRRLDEPLDSLLGQEQRLADLILKCFGSGRMAYVAERTAEMPAESLGPWGLAFKAYWRHDVGDARARTEARSWFERAVALDPSQPVFKAWLAICLVHRVMHGVSDEPERETRRARELAESAARLCDGKMYSGTAVMHAGDAFGYLGDHERALGLCRRAHELAPGFVIANSILAQRLLYAGRAEEALRLFEADASLRLPGFPAVAGCFVLQCHMVRGDHEAALARARADMSEIPARVHWSRAWEVCTACANALARADRVDEAAAALVRARSLAPELALRGLVDAYRWLYATEAAREAVACGLERLLALGYE